MAGSILVRDVQVLDTNYPGIALTALCSANLAESLTVGLLLRRRCIGKCRRFFHQNPAAVITGGAIV